MIGGRTLPFHYVRDDARRRIRITARAPLQVADLIAIIDRQASEETWAYGLLYDLRAIHGGTPRGDAGRVAQHVQTYVRVYGARGCVALVTRQADMIGTGQLYASFGAKVGFQVEVFWDVAEAERWLDEQQSQREKPEP